jgi:monofunctional biosynthetic peptidoglycan transglycosylase
MATRRRTNLLWRAVKWAAYVAAVLLLVDGFFLSRLWPDWSSLAHGPVPKSRFIRAYEQQQLYRRGWPVLRWQPVALKSIPEPVVRAVVIAEDARFFEHAGFDLAAIREAIEYNLQEGRFARGASTISQQTAKNLFLTPARDPLRKWHEAILTWAMERRLSKRRILELYLNIAEFGRGIYGVEAAARSYWNRPVARLNLDQAAGLAACLPSPRRNNPHTRTRFYQRHHAKIKARLERALGYTDAERGGEGQGKTGPWWQRLGDWLKEAPNPAIFDEERAD